MAVGSPRLSSFRGPENARKREQITTPPSHPPCPTVTGFAQLRCRFSFEREGGY